MSGFTSLTSFAARAFRDGLQGCGDKAATCAHLLVLARTPDDAELAATARLAPAALLRRLARSDEFRNEIAPAFCAAAEQRVPPPERLSETQEWLAASRLVADIARARAASGWTALRRVVFVDAGFRAVLGEAAKALEAFPGDGAFRSGRPIDDVEPSPPGDVVDAEEAEALNRLFLTEGAVAPGATRAEALKEALATPGAREALAAPASAAPHLRRLSPPSASEAMALARFFDDGAIAAARSWRAALRAALETPRLFGLARGVEGLPAALLRAAGGAEVRLRPDGLVVAPPSRSGPLEIEIYLASGEPLTRRLLPPLEIREDAALFPPPASPRFPEPIVVAARPAGCERWSLLDMNDVCASSSAPPTGVSPPRATTWRVEIVAGRIEGVAPPDAVETGAEVVLEHRPVAAGTGWERAGAGPIGTDGAFSLPLPPEALAHERVEARLRRGGAAAEEAVWTGGVRIDREAVETWLRAAAADPVAEAALLGRIAQGGRIDLAVAALEWIEAREETVDPPGALVALQIMAFIHGANRDLPPARRGALIGRLWRRTDPDHLFSPMRRTAAAAMTAAGGRARLRFRTGESAEAVVDAAVLRGQSGDDAAAADAADTLLALERLPMARRVLRAAAAAKPDSARLAAVEARIALRSGNVEAARAAALRAIKAQPGNRAARETLARCHAIAGRSLAAVQVATEARGLSEPLPVDAARLALPLGWRDAADAWADRNAGLADLAARRARTAPPPTRPDFSVFLAPGCGDFSDLEMADLFETLGPDCRQFARAEEDDMSALGALGAWAIVLIEPGPLKPGVLDRVMAQRWRHVCAIRMTAGGARSARLAGVAARSDLAGLFGQLPAAKFIELAERRLKTQTVAVGR